MFKPTTHGLKILWEHIVRSGLTLPEQLSSLPDTMTEVFSSEYGGICEDLREDLTGLADAMEIVTATHPVDRHEALAVVEEKYENLCVDFEILVKYHEELRRRYKNATV